MGALKLGIIGAGQTTELHADGYLESADAEIVAVCDASEDRAISRSLDWGADAYFTDVSRMFQEANLDAVEILTPHEQHREQAIRALKNGCHVCVKRPVAMSIEGADSVISAAREADRALQVFEPSLFHKPLLDARNLIDNGEIGNPTAVNISANIATSAEDGWMRRADAPERWQLAQREKGTSPLLFEVGYQAFSIALFLIGSVEKVEVWRSQSKFLDDLTIDAPTTAMWKHFQQECYGSFSFTYTPKRQLESKYRPLELEIDVVGSRGDLTIYRTPDPARYEAAVRLRRAGRTVLYDQKLRAYEQSYTRATENFIEACRGETSPLLRGSEAKQLLVLTLAFSESAKHAQSVSLQHG